MESAITPPGRPPSEFHLAEDRNDDPMTTRMSQMVGFCGLGGLLSGGVGTAAQGIVGGIQPTELLTLTIVVGSLIGLVGGLLAGSLAWILVRRRPAGEYATVENLLLALTASLTSGVALYLLIFAFQVSQAPALVIGLPAILFTTIIVTALKGGRRPLPLAVRSRWLYPPLAVISGIAGTSITLWIVFVLTPPSISAGLTWASLSLTPPAAQQDTLLRLLLFVGLMLCAVVAVSAGTTVSGRRGRSLVLAALSIPLSVALLHLSWLAAAPTSALVQLAQSPSPSNPWAFIVQAAGWIAIVAWLIVAWVRVLATRST